MVYLVPHYINGEFKSEKGALSHPVYNPCLGEQIGELHFASEKMAQAAIDSAAKAFGPWSQTPPTKRAKILFNFRNLVDKYQDDIAKLVTKEHGKTIEDAKGSIMRALEVIEYHCAIVSQLQGSLTMEASSHIDCYTFRQPLGVCVGISPFNFPVMVPIWLMIAAIATGNTFILKPSEQTPSAALRLFSLLTEAGLPKGVANCLQGSKETVDYLITHPTVKACSAIASTPVAKSIYQKALALGKRVHTFGGAKNHCLLMPDASLEKASEALSGAGFGSAGERCMAISVIVAVGDETADKFLKVFMPLVKAIRIGSGFETAVDMGPLISKAHRDKVLALVDAGVKEGAQLLIDGRNFYNETYPQGFFMGPCLFDKVTESMTIYQTEIFGPVLCLIRVPDFKAGIELINRNQYGNGAAIFTRDGYTARVFSQEVEAGMIGINIPIPVPIANHSFGGLKQSFFGDIALHGESSIHFYTKTKTVTAKWFSEAAKTSPFIMPTH